MAIERAIYAFVKQGIEGVQGDTYYSYTPGYKKIVEKMSITTQGIEGMLTGFYKRHELSFSIPIPQSNQEANDDEKKFRAFYPMTMAYRVEQAEGKKKAVFLFGKHMGWDWTGSRPGNMYNASVICDMTDIKRPPVFYCSSPIVCCDIPRSALYPEGNVLQPEMFEYSRSLEAKDDVLRIRHSAGFRNISINDMVKFIRADNRMEILKKMLCALMNLKEGNKDYRIVLADKRENMLFWIAALSYIFPLQNVWQFSFTTYGYHIEEYDVNGVYVPELNGQADVSYGATDYVWEKCKDTFAVFDFHKSFYAPQVSVEKNLFMDCLEHAFFSDMKELDRYKQFIAKNTLYKGMNRQYMNGYKLFVYTQLGVRLSLPDVSDAVLFATDFASEELKLQLLEQLLELCKKNIQDKAFTEIFKSYMTHCVENSIVQKQEIEGALLANVFECFEDEANDLNLFFVMGDAVEDICGFQGDDFERAFIKHYGIKNLFQMVDRITDKKRISYIFNAITSHISHGYCEFRKDAPAYELICRILDNMLDKASVKNERAIKDVLNKEFAELSSVRLKLLFADAMYNIVERKAMNQAQDIVLIQIGDIYIKGSQKDRDDFMKEVTALPKKSSEVYLRNVLKVITEERNIGRKLEELEFLIRKYPREYSRYIDQITGVVEKALSVNLDSVDYGERTEIIYDCYQILQLCEQEFGREIQDERKADIKEQYIRAVFEKNNDFIISEEQFKQFHKIFPISSENEFIRAFYSIHEMKNGIEKKNEKIFRNLSKCGIVQLERIQEQKYINAYLSTTAQYCGQYWIKYNECPDITGIFNVTRDNKKKIMYNFFRYLVLYFVENPDIKGKKQVKLVLNLTELLLADQDLHKLSGEIPDILAHSNIKRSDMIKALDKDIEDVRQGKVRTNSLKYINYQDLQDMRQRILEAYEESPGASIIDGMKNGINNLISWLGIKK